MEQLTQVQISVRSVSRKDENLWQSPAAVYVITRDQIEHSTASGIPELLRAVPGMQVAQLSRLGEGHEQSRESMGSGYGGTFHQQAATDVDLPTDPSGHDSDSNYGGMVLTRWEHIAERSDPEPTGYYADETRNELASAVRMRTADVDFVDHPRKSEQLDLVYGAEINLTADTIKGAVLPAIRPNYFIYLVDGFAQAQIALLPDRLSLTLGSKLQEGT